MGNVLQDIANGIVPTEDPSVFDALAVLTQLDQQAIIRPTIPPPGIAGYVFDILEDETVQIESRITDNFIEDNTAIQDHIALAPEIVTVRGLVGELVDYVTTPSALRAVVPDVMPLNFPMVPLLSIGAIQAQKLRNATANSLRDSTLSSNSLYAYYDRRVAKTLKLTGLGNFNTQVLTNKRSVQTRQQQTFNFFYQLWKARMIFTVETPFGFWPNMAILSMRANQSAASRYISDFTITFKVISKVQSLTVNLGQLAGRAVSAAQGSQPTNSGTNGTTPLTASASASVLYQIAHGQ